MRVSRQDIRLAIRSFARHPGFTATAIVSLALAIALNTTMYSVIDAMVKPNVDIQHSDRFYRIVLWHDRRRPLEDARLVQILTSEMRTYDALTSQASYDPTAVVELGDNYSERTVARLSTNAFDIYGIHALRGRTFIPEDSAAEIAPIVISEQLESSLAGDSTFTLGTKLMIDGVARPVVGVIRRGAISGGPRRPDVFVPISAHTDIIRLRPKATIADANAEFQILSARVAALTGELPKDVRLELKPLITSQFRPQRFHFALIAAVIAVLLVACANLANLQLARGIGRSRELALRTALGASRRDIVVQLLVETAVLATAGFLLGVVLTFWGVHLLDSRVPPEIADYVFEPQISWRVFAFAAVTSLVAVVLVGLLPAVRVSRVNPNELLKSGAGTGANRRNRQQYGVLVAAEIGLSLALLSGAALVVRTAMHLQVIDMGYDTRPISTGSIVLKAPRDTLLNAASYTNALLTAVRNAPEVERVAVVLRGKAPGYSVTVDERHGTPHEFFAPLFGYSITTAEYFRAMGLPIIKGRNFLDGLATVPEVIVDRRTAENLWPGVDPIGQQIKLGEYKSNAPWVRVVGVVPNVNDESQLVRYNASTNPSKVGAMYVSQTASDSIVVAKYSGSFSVIVRARRDPERMPMLLDRLLPVADLVRYRNFHTMEDELGITRDRARHDFVAAIFATFAVMALGLASLGIYGIVAHSVAERRRELGVRLALGASSRNILDAVLREGNAVALSGVAVGLLMTKYTAGWLAAFIFEDDQYNAPMFAAAGAVLFLVAVASALWPALRATRIDPVESLRSE